MIDDDDDDDDGGELELLFCGRVQRGEEFLGVFFFFFNTFYLSLI